MSSRFIRCAQSRAFAILIGATCCGLCITSLPRFADAAPQTQAADAIPRHEQGAARTAERDAAWQEDADSEENQGSKRTEPRIALPPQCAFSECAELLVDGKATDFHTPAGSPPPIGLPHPRLMFTESGRDAIRRKLADPAYAHERALLTETIASPEPGDESVLAFAWQIWADESARDRAITKLVQGDIQKWGFPYYGPQWVFVWAVMYDWLAEAMSTEQRAAAWTRFNERDGSHKTSNLQLLQRGERAPKFNMNHNDSWGKLPACFEAAVAFAIRGDGLADELAESIIASIFADDPSFCSPYRMLDWLNLMALDSGGTQAGHDVSDFDGYNGFYIASTLLLTGYWESATGENLWARNNFYRYFPLWATYDSHVPLLAKGTEVMDVVAGRYRDIDPDMAALAAWQLQQRGKETSKRAHLLPRLIWGDRRVQAKSPAELALPLARHLRGADMFVSRHSWDTDAVVVNLATRTLDTLRYEPYPGAISIYRDDVPILVDSRKGKWRRKIHGTSAVDIYRKGANVKNGIGSMYGARPRRFRKLARPESAEEIITHGAYYPNALKQQRITDWYHSATVHYEHLLIDERASRAERTMIHIKPVTVPGRTGEYVVVIDRIEAPDDLDNITGWRLASEPRVSGNGFVWDGAAATILDEQARAPQWIGGAGREMETPNGSWGGDKKGGYVPGYSSEPERARRFGIGSVYLVGTGSELTVTIIEIDATEPPTATWTEPGSGIEFGHFELEIRPEGFELARRSE